VTARQTRIGATYAALAIALIAAFALSLWVGRAPWAAGTSLGDLWSADPQAARLIFWELRWPRALLALLIGGALGLAGAALQGLLRNPLADPGVTGASSIASLGAVLIFYYGLADAWPYALPLAGIAGAGVSVFALYAIAGRGASTLTLILAGVAIASLGGALVSLALNLAPSPYAALEILFWLLGSLVDRSMQDVWLAGPFILVGACLLLAAGRGLDALALGEETARSSGVDIDRTRWLVIGGTALAIGAAVAVTGVIGFIGLVAPHLLRRFVRHRPSALLGASFLGGATLLLLADVVSRLLSFGPELHIGVVTALVGAPFFLWLVFATRSER
jgi:iron complex transport system permease protein